MEIELEPADSLEVGLLGAFHIKRLWSKTLIKLSDPSRKWLDEWELDKITIYSLGLSLEETHQYLASQRPAFDEFEHWIMEKNNGRVSKHQVSRLNSAVSGAAQTDEVSEWIDEIEKAEPVLSDQDLCFWQENGYVLQVYVFNSGQ